MPPDFNAKDYSLLILMHIGKSTQRKPMATMETPDDSIYEVIQTI